MFDRPIGDASHLAGAMTWDEFHTLMLHVRKHNMLGNTLGKAPGIKKLIPHMEVTSGQLNQIKLIPASSKDAITIEARDLPDGISMFTATMVYLMNGAQAYREFMGITRVVKPRSKPLPPTTVSPFSAPIPKF